MNSKRQILKKGTQGPGTGDSESSVSLDPSRKMWNLSWIRTVEDRDCPGSHSLQAAGGLGVWTGVPSPDGQQWEQGHCMVLCSFQRAFYLKFWLTQFLLCVFWILLSSSFYGWGNGLKPLAQTHRANNKHQAGLKGKPVSLCPCTQSPSGERTGTSLPIRDLVGT